MFQQCQTHAYPVRGLELAFDNMLLVGGAVTVTLPSVYSSEWVSSDPTQLEVSLVNTQLMNGIAGRQLDKLLAFVCVCVQFCHTL